MIRVSKLTKRFGLKTVLKGVDFEAEDGEFVALLGPNGAGKTTFLRILATLISPTFGEVSLAGYRLPEQAAVVRRHLGMLSHFPLLYENLTAEENLRFYGRLYGVIDLGRRADEMLSLVGLEKLRGELVRTFSRGMQQRLAIARALMHDPNILLFDEPYTGLDQDASTRLDQILASVAAEGRTVVMASHDLSRASQLATRFDVLSHGRIAASTNRSKMGRKDLLAFYSEAIGAEDAHAG
jgi:heme exporter protein A